MLSWTGEATVNGNNGNNGNAKISCDINQR